MCSRRRRGALTACLDMICVNGLMHTVARVLGQAIALICSPMGKRALTLRLRCRRNLSRTYGIVTLLVGISAGRKRR